MSLPISPDSTFVVPSDSANKALGFWNSNDAISAQRLSQIIKTLLLSNKHVGWNPNEKSKYIFQDFMQGIFFSDKRFSWLGSSMGGQWWHFTALQNKVYCLAFKITPNYVDETVDHFAQNGSIIPVPVHRIEMDESYDYGTNVRSQNGWRIEPVVFDTGAGIDGVIASESATMSEVMLRNPFGDDVDYYTLEHDETSFAQKARLHRIYSRQNPYSDKNDIQMEWIVPACFLNTCDSEKWSNSDFVGMGAFHVELKEPFGNHYYIEAPVLDALPVIAALNTSTTMPIDVGGVSTERHIATGGENLIVGNRASVRSFDFGDQPAQLVNKRIKVPKSRFSSTVLNGNNFHKCEFEESFLVNETTFFGCLFDILSLDVSIPLKADRFVFRIEPGDNYNYGVSSIWIPVANRVDAGVGFIFMCDKYHDVYPNTLFIKDTLFDLIYYDDIILETPCYSREGLSTVVASSLEVWNTSEEENTVLGGRLISNVVSGYKNIKTDTVENDNNSLRVVDKNALGKLVPYERQGIVYNDLTIGLVIPNQKASYFIGENATLDWTEGPIQEINIIKTNKFVDGLWGIESYKLLITVSPSEGIIITYNAAQIGTIDFVNGKVFIDWSLMPSAEFNTEVLGTNQWVVSIVFGSNIKHGSKEFAGSIEANKIVSDMRVPYVEIATKDVEEYIDSFDGKYYSNCWKLKNIPVIIKDTSGASMINDFVVSTDVSGSLRYTLTAINDNVIKCVPPGGGGSDYELLVFLDSGQIVPAKRGALYIDTVFPSFYVKYRSYARSSKSKITGVKTNKLVAPEVMKIYQMHVYDWTVHEVDYSVMWNEHGQGGIGDTRDFIMKEIDEGSSEYVLHFKYWNNTPSSDEIANANALGTISFANGSLWMCRTLPSGLVLDENSGFYYAPVVISNSVSPKINDNDVLVSIKWKVL